MTSSDITRTLTVIVVADIVGYSRLMGADEAETLRRLTQYRAEIIDPTVAQFRGRVVNSVGDSLLMAFDSVVEATRCAIALQHALAGRNADLDESRRMVMRMGVNIGDVLVRDRGLFGDGVNIAARLQALAEPGGLCLSGGAYEQVAGKIAVPFVDMGAQQVKNIAREVRAFGLSAEAIGALPLASPPAARGTRRRVAFIAAGLAALTLAGGGALFWRRSGAPDFAARMDAILAASQARQSARARQNTIADYQAIGDHKAMAIAPKAQSKWWTGDWPTPELAVEKALERCQLAFAEPCRVAAVDADIAAPAEAARPRDMSRLAYAGDFDPAQIPGIRPITADRADLVGYAAAPGPKAAAIHPRGIVAVVTGAASQRRAETLALEQCNDDDAAREADGPCYLYAQGDKVVLPQRLTTASASP